MRRILAVALVLAAGCSSSGTKAASPEIREAPTAYVVVYRVTTADTVSTERLSVRRPFDGRIELYRGEPPGTGTPSVSVSSFGRLLLAAGGSQNGLVAQPPSPAIGDV